MDTASSKKKPVVYTDLRPQTRATGPATFPDGLAFGHNTKPADTTDSEIEAPTTISHNTNMADVAKCKTCTKTVRCAEHPCDDCEVSNCTKHNCHLCGQSGCTRPDHAYTHNGKVSREFNMLHEALAKQARQLEETRDQLNTYSREYKTVKDSNTENEKRISELLKTVENLTKQHKEQETTIREQQTLLNARPPKAEPTEGAAPKCTTIPQSLTDALEALTRSGKQSQLSTAVLQEITTFDGSDPSALEDWLEEVTMCSESLELPTRELAFAKSKGIARTIVDQSISQKMDWESMKDHLRQTISRAGIHAHINAFMDFKQLPTENLTNYTIRFRKTAARAQITQPAILIRVFVRGLTDQTYTPRKIYEREPTTMDSVYETVERLERTRAATESLHTPTNTVQAVSSPGCYTCGNPDHWTQSCPNRTCYTCGEPGHIAKFCQKPLNRDSGNHRSRRDYGSNRDRYPSSDRHRSSSRSDRRSDRDGSRDRRDYSSDRSRSYRDDSRDRRGRSRDRRSYSRDRRSYSRDRRSYSKDRREPSRDRRDYSRSRRDSSRHRRDPSRERSDRGSDNRRSSSRDRHRSNSRDHGDRNRRQDSSSNGYRSSSRRSSTPYNSDRRVRVEEPSDSSKDSQEPLNS